MWHPTRAGRARALALAKYPGNGSTTFGWGQVGSDTLGDQGNGVAVGGTSCGAVA